MKCPKCGNTWIIDRTLVMTIDKSLEIKKPKLEHRWKCISCETEWGE